MLGVDKPPTRATLELEGMTMAKTVSEWVANGGRIKRGPMRNARGYTPMAGVSKVKFSSGGTARGKISEKKFHKKMAA